MSASDLAAFPLQLREWIQSAPRESLRTRARDGRFALVEQAWHLADLEVEGYGARIELLLKETNPELPDFRGDVVAEERRYLELDVEPALERFARAREANLQRIASLSEGDLQREGTQEGVGRVTVARVVEMMAEHDAGHAAEVRELLEELRA